MNGKENKRAWTKKEIRILKTMSKEGRTNKEISEVLERTPGAIGFRKSQMQMKMKSKKIRVSPGVVQATPVPVVTTRDQAKSMARAARGIARANGKRITMAMFFVEDL
jgi:NADP-dependent 3-hydroxy acid dehydrogenase YdfG